MNTEPDLEGGHWREILLGRVRFVVLAAFVIAGILTTTLVRTDLLRFGGVAVLGIAIAIIVLFSRPNLAYALRAWITVGALFLGSAIAYVTVGFNPGAVLSAGLCIVISGLLLGKRAMAGTLGGIILVSLLVAGSVWLGVWEGPADEERAMGDPLIWLRITLMSAVFWGAIALSVMLVVDDMERGVARRDTALREKDSAVARLEEEARQRRVAESARRKAVEVANQAQKLEAVGRLAAGVAHDFNNALLVIQGWNEIRGQSDSDVQQSKATKAISQATLQASQLARHLLTLGRKEVRAPGYLQADRIVEDTGQSLKTLLHAGIELKVETQQDLTVYADEAQLQQLILNLVINARDALPEGGDIHLRVRLDHEGPTTGQHPRRPFNDEQWVLIQVEDQGVGMDEQTLDRAFEPFFTTKETGQGTGLGLSAAYGIVEQSGGHIELTSQPGEGTVVSIFLPLVRASPRVEEEDAPVAQKTTPLTARVLVLEDDQAVRELITHTLRRAGLDVVAAEDGNAVMEVMRHETSSFDILCADAVFPGATLSDVLGAFERHSPKAKILICSGFVEEELAIKGVESGEYGFLAKPFSVSALMTEIRSML